MSAIIKLRKELCNIFGLEPALDLNHRRYLDDAENAIRNYACAVILEEELERMTNNE